MTHKICKTAVGTCPYMLDCIALISIISEKYNQEISEKAVSKEPFVLKYCLDKYKSHEMGTDAVDACLPLLKLVTDWFITNKMLKDHDNVVFFNDHIVFVNANSDTVAFFSYDMVLINVDLNNVSLDHDNVDDDDPEFFDCVKS